MEILTREKCKHCDGNGIVYNPIWKEFNDLDDEFQKRHGHFMSQEKCDAWFHERGYHKLPSEEIPCHECEGNGIVQEWKSVDEIAGMILNIGIHNGSIPSPCIH